MSAPGDGGLSRRDFLQMVGATLAAAGLPGCNPPPEAILPYTRRPGGLVPGVPLHFATGWDLDGSAAGLLVESREGRPVKIEGNPDHPSNLGAASPWEQAALLGLYDPDRAQRIKQRGLPSSHAELVAALSPARFTNGGARLRFLMAPSSSLLQAELRSRLGKRYPAARFYAWSAVASESVAEGARIAFGRPLAARLHLDRADTILTLDADPFAGGGDALRLQREFAARRAMEPRPGGGGLGGGAPPNRLYAVEARPTLAGLSADHRLRLRAVEIEGFARALLAELGARMRGGALAGLTGLEEGASSTTGYDRKFLGALAGDLARSGPRSLIIAGGRQPPIVHAIAHALNHALGCVGTTVELGPPVDTTASGPAALHALIDELREGAVDTLVITAWNPVYSAPADLELAAALARAPHTVYLATHEDETYPHVEWLVPAAHFLESWGDSRAPDGTAALQQPLIAPLFNGLCASELLSLLLPDADVLPPAEPATAVQVAQRAADEPLPPQGEPPLATSELRAQPQASRDQRPADNRRTWFLLRDTWRRAMPGAAPAARGRTSPSAAGEDFQAFWESALRRGTIAAPAAEPASARPPALDRAALRTALAVGTAPAAAGLELGFHPDARLYDGRFANNPWLLELPDPITGVTWDNALELSPRTAARLELRTGDVVDAQWKGRTLRAPIFVTAGHADESVSITLGWGREGTGRHADGAGFNASILRQSTTPWFGTGLNLEKTGERHEFAVPQQHVHLDGRTIAVETTLPELLRHPDFLALQRESLPTLYSEQSYPDHRWGMAIDLSRCTGCEACVVACQAENNVPWVGKEQVIRGRIMHWIRIDRYLTGAGAAGEESGQRVPMPLMCVHCEMAPCEYVCPVNATVHSDEGLNEMVYNRCVGTRYCSNNCPYKVRRFNYLDFHDDARMLPVLRMAQNPEVTVRSRGVMEKCTYCVQRIEHERIDARVAGRAMRPIQSACQQTCPTEAIVFGDLNDGNAEVTRRHHGARAYLLLNELNTRPRTAHLARVRNPNPELAEHA